MEIGGGDYLGALGPDVVLAKFTGYAPTGLQPGATFSISATDESLFSGVDFQGYHFAMISPATFLVVPEPSTTILLLGVALPLAARRNRRPDPVGVSVSF